MNGDLTSTLALLAVAPHVKLGPRFGDEKCGGIAGREGEEGECSCHRFIGSPDDMKTWFESGHGTKYGARCYSASASGEENEEKERGVTSGVLYPAANTSASACVAKTRTS